MDKKMGRQLQVHRKKPPPSGGPPGGFSFAEFVPGDLGVLFLRVLDQGTKYIGNPPGFLSIKVEKGEKITLNANAQKTILQIF